MKRLDPARVRWIVVHTAESAGDVSAAEIRRWHVDERGWEDIGYHYVVHFDGSVETGRPVKYQGAHVFGINGESIGVCFTGNGDRHGWTLDQSRAGLALLQALLIRYDLPVPALIGHHEINRLVDRGLVPEEIDGRGVRTSKTCPGRLVDMDRVRALVPLVPAARAELAETFQ